jgi:hypothetical protein
MRMKHILETPDVYSGQSERLSEALQDAYRKQDNTAAMAILDAARMLIRHLRLGVQAKYGQFRSHSMGAYKFKKSNWRGKTPQEVIDDLYTATNFDEWWAGVLKLRAPKEVGQKKRQTEEERRRLEAYLKFFVRALREFTMDNWPGWWTAAREEEFKRYLPKKRGQP